jgi:hypothetical protein
MGNVLMSGQVATANGAFHLDQEQLCIQARCSQRALPLPSNHLLPSHPKIYLRSLSPSMIQRSSVP